MASFFSSPSSRNKLKSLTTDRDDDKFIQRVDGGVQLNIPVPGPFGSGTIPINLTKQSAKDVTRQVAQGITLGTADEIESYVRSLAGKDRDEALEEIRTEIKRFEQNNPGVALSSEIVGSALTGGLGLGKTAVRTFLKSTGSGWRDLVTVGSAVSVGVLNIPCISKFIRGISLTAQTIENVPLQPVILCLTPS